MRIVFQDRPSLIQFRDAALRTFRFVVKGRFTSIDADRLHLFEKIHTIDTWAGTLDLRVALQVSALYMNGLLDPNEILSLRPNIDQLAELYQDKPDRLARLLGLFADRMQRAQYTALTMHGQSEASPIPICDIMIRACAAIVTPTCIHLEGPYLDQSNSVLRAYPEHQHYFLRLSFASEDHLPLYNDRDVDSRLFVGYRIGTILREGVTLAGRHFEFLAYSLSALRQHSVWMVAPFDHPVLGLMTANRVRDRLGDFSRVSKCPARYGARLAQAFTATEPSIVLKPENIVEIPDKINKANKLIFTDGVGGMSLELLEGTWKRLVENRPHLRTKIDFPATVFQFRLGGNKGLLSLNPLLPGLVMQVRPSMNKFDAPDSLGLEIAKSFERPRPFFLNRPFIMLLESRGVHADVFLTLQRNAVKAVEDSKSSLIRASIMTETYGLGGTFWIRLILRNIHDILGLDFEAGQGLTTFYDPFLKHIIDVGKANALREIRFRARIPVPNSWTLIGVADEHDVLGKNEIYACIHKPGDPEPHWIEGPAIVTKSPSLGPGDAQFVTGIGRPPPDCPFMLGPYPLKNCVVFSCRGVRPIPSMLGGGDLDGDEFNVVQYSSLFPQYPADPDDYTAAERAELDRDCTMNDVIDFIIDYVNNDLVGRLATEHLILADQHPDGVKYSNCHQLAQLYALALDFAKTGTPIDQDQIPSLLNDMKPDYLQREQQVGKQSTKFYQSQRALGHMFREPDLQIDFDAIREESTFSETNGFDGDILFHRVRDLVTKYISVSALVLPNTPELFDRYVEELRHACLTTSTGPRTQEATEGEAVMGVILSNAFHPKIRLDRVYRLRLQITNLVNSVRSEFQGLEDDPLRVRLERAYAGWDHSRSRGFEFGARSFALIALSAIFHYIEEIDNDAR
ncbi:RdRP-domain-containing protein [Dacryopinax primogenitus]|uniref:RNA-dependent RNA polymerase n=1 Tax=Dacryopinax primogenitus (strain DJM 731) TaxID=1858805 RepID=M5G3P1_DACPD|nr:RdRP-domain-containing protein [Dacryopinax primogenitus]EJT98377.1 RdRP-domain-containing protein [Dacryopinax primogenitus]